MKGAPPPLLFAGFVAVSGTVLALIGPFGTMLTMPLPGRMAHWLLSCGAIGLVTFGGIMVARRLWWSKATPAWGLALVTAAAAPGAPIIEACLGTLSPDSLNHVSWAQLFGQCLLLNEVLTDVTP